MTMNRTTIRTFLAAGALAVFALACNDDRTGGRTGLVSPVPRFGKTNPLNAGTNCLAQDAFLAGHTSGVNDPNDIANPDQNCKSGDMAFSTALVDSFSLNGGLTWSHVQQGVSIPCTEGVAFLIAMSDTLKETANSDRADVGIWIATDGGNARTGTCDQYNIITAANGNTATGLTNADGDNCGGIAAHGAARTTLGTLSVVCPAAGDTLVHVGSCLAWNTPGQDQVCPSGFPTAATAFPDLAAENPTAYRFGTTPGSTSKCNCSGFDVKVLHTGTITIIKNTVGGDATFPYTQDVGTNSDPVVPASFTITTSGGTQQQQILKVQPGTYHVAEGTLPTGWDFTSLECTTGGTVSSKTATITITKLGENVTCTYTNTKRASLTLAKHVINDNGGSANASAWTLTATGTSGGFSGTGLPATGTDASVGPNFVTAGVQYTLTESGGPASGYSSTGAFVCCQSFPAC